MTKLGSMVIRRMRTLFDANPSYLLQLHLHNRVLAGWGSPIPPSPRLAGQPRDSQCPAGIAARAQTAPPPRRAAGRGAAADRAHPPRRRLRRRSERWRRGQQGPGSAEPEQPDQQLRKM
jgi:hypothetical protein